MYNTFQYLEYNAISLGYQCITNDIAILFYLKTHSKGSGQQKAYFESLL